MVRKLVLLLLVMVLMAPAAFAGDLVGWITDEHCGEKGANAEHKSCALRCNGRGTALVFFNIEDSKIYKLSDQEAAKANVGHKVKIEGTIEESTIKVTSIKPVEEKKSE